MIYMIGDIFCKYPVEKQVLHSMYIQNYFMSAANDIHLKITLKEITIIIVDKIDL